MTACKQPTNVSGARDAAIEAARASGDHLPALDGLRGVAILLVFLVHAIGVPLGGMTRVDAAGRTIAMAGWTGVGLFFVLSGVLITGMLLHTQGHPHCGA